MKQLFFRISLFYLFLIALPNFSEARAAFISQDSIVVDSIENDVFLLQREYKELRGMKITAIAALGFFILSVLLIIFQSEVFLLWAVSLLIAMLVSLSSLGKTRKFSKILKNMDENNPDYDLIKSSVTWARIARASIFFPFLLLILFVFVFEIADIDVSLFNLISGFSILGFLIGNYFLFKDKK